MDTASVWVISGPTAVGKGTVVAKLLERHPEFYLSISATTRQPRPTEVDGESYYFVSPKRFDELIANDQMLEWAEVHGSNKYGTLRQPVEDALKAGRTVILEIDLAGARQVAKSLPEAKSIFLAPPSWAELVNRLQGRKTETEQQQARRLRTAIGELAAASEFDYIVVNDDLTTTVENLLSLLSST